MRRAAESFAKLERELASLTRMVEEESILSHGVLPPLGSGRIPDNGVRR
jgi:hypothetical protein